MPDSRAPGPDADECQLLAADGTEPWEQGRWRLAVLEGQEFPDNALASPTPLGAALGPPRAHQAGEMPGCLFRPSVLGVELGVGPGHPQPSQAPWGLHHAGGIGLRAPSPTHSLCALLGCLHKINRKRTGRRLVSGWRGLSNLVVGKHRETDLTSSPCPSAGARGHGSTRRDASDAMGKGGTNRGWGSPWQPSSG